MEISREKKDKILRNAEILMLKTELLIKPAFAGRRSEKRGKTYQGTEKGREKGENEQDFDRIFKMDGIIGIEKVLQTFGNKGYS
jgi:hypothetical protein